MDKGRKISRRDFLKVLRTGVVDLGVLFFGMVGYSFWVEPQWIQVERVTLKLPRLSPAFSGLRIAQVSDIHMGGWMDADRFQRVVDLVMKEEPDLLLLTGDFLLGHDFDEHTQQSLSGLKKIMLPLAKAFPSFAVLGNHDYWTNARAIRIMLEQCSVHDLTNSVFTIHRSHEKLFLCGVDDVWEGNVRLDVVLDHLPEEGAAILLAHEPDFADTSALTGRFDLQVSGHSHGGQVVIPFLGPPVVPYLGQKYPSGLYRVGEMYQYTNRGVGMARLPVRINCPPEITIFTLEA